MAHKTILSKYASQTELHYLRSTFPAT